MLTLLWIILALVGVILLLVLAVLALPVHLRLRAEADEAAARVRLDIRLFGGLTPPLAVFDSARPRKERPTEVQAKPAEEPEERAKPARKGGGFRLPGGRRTAMRMVREIPGLIAGEFRRIHLDGLEVDGDFSLGDPAETGMLYGYLTPAIYGPRSEKVRLNLRPDFGRARLSGTALAALHLTPGALAIPVIRYGWRVFVARS